MEVTSMLTAISWPRRSKIVPRLPTALRESSTWSVALRDSQEPS